MNKLLDSLCSCGHSSLVCSYQIHSVVCSFRVSLSYQTLRYLFPASLSVLASQWLCEIYNKLIISTGVLFRRTDL